MDMRNPSRFHVVYPGVVSNKPMGLVNESKRGKEENWEREGEGEWRKENGEGEGEKENGEGEEKRS